MDYESYTIILISINPLYRLRMCATIRRLEGFGLKESIDAVDNLPHVMRGGMTLAEVENWESQVVKSGGEVQIIKNFYHDPYVTL